MNSQELLDSLKVIIIPLLEYQDVILVDLNLSRTREGIILRLLLDKKEGGITLADCAGLNRGIGELLDANDIIKDRYILEVSSPGLDRPLKTKEDFARCKNREVMVFLNQPLGGAMQIEGSIDKVDEEAVSILTGKGTEVVPLVNIHKAKQRIL